MDAIETLINMLGNELLARAVLVGLLVSVCAALLGVSMVLKRNSMIGDGLSHIGFGALALASVLGLPPLSLAIPFSLLAAFILLRLSENSKIRSDAAIAMIAAGSLAVGVLIISMSDVGNKDLNSYLFGSILATSRSDVYFSLVLTVLVLAVFILCYNKIFAVTFDENFARATGVKVDFYNTLIAMLAALTVVLGMRIVGSMLISGLIIFPALSAMHICKSFRNVTICAVFIAIFCFLLGMAISFIYDLPSGAAVIVVNIVMLAVFSVFGWRRERR